MGTARDNPTGKARHPANPDRPESQGVLKALEDNDLEALKLALTPRQRQFVKEYVVDFNGTAAAIRSGYAGKYADRQASQLLKHKGIARLIEDSVTSNAAKMISIDGDYIIQGILQIIQRESGKDNDKLRGYELLARLKGLFVDRQEITGRDGGAIEIEKREIDEETESVINLLNSMRKKEDKKDVFLV